MKLTKKTSFLILVLGFSVFILISGCDQNPNINLESGTFTNTPTSTQTPTKSPTVTNTPTLTPTNTPTLTPSPTYAPRAWRIPVLEYHNPSYNGGERVMMKPDWFEDQLEWLFDNGFITLTSEEFHYYLTGEAQPQRKSVVLRFDIGIPDYEEYSEIVIPLLRKFDFHAFFFLVTPSFTDDCNHPNDMICWNDLLGWEEEGLITIGSHGIDHPDYQNITQALAKWDAGESKVIIENALNHPIYWFTYPYDSVPENPKSLLEPLGYWGGFTGWPDFTDRSVEFGIEDIWEISSYYPYSSEESYPLLTTTSPYPYSEFGEWIMSSIKINEVDITPVPTSNLAETPTPIAFVPVETLTPSEISDPDTEERANALEEYTNYCRSRNGKELDEFYIDENPFFTDVSVNAQQNLGIPVLVKPVCHFGLDNGPEAVVLHFTGSLGNHQVSVNHFRTPDLGISSHYIIDRDGTVVQLVPESYVAYHVSCFGDSAQYCLPNAPLAFDENGNTSLPETRSIGIEIANAGPLVYRNNTPDTLTDKYGKPFIGDTFIYSDFSLTGQYKYEKWEPYSPEQLISLDILINDIFERWGINLLLGHSDIQPNIDPGPALSDFIEKYRK